MPTSALIMGGLGAAGSIGSAFIGSNAAQQASSQQVAAQQQVLATLQKIIGPIISQGQGVAGQGQGIISSALGPLTSLLTPGANMTQTLSQIPGFTFAQDWGQKAVQNIGTTQGLGGNTLAAGAQFATGLAQQGYGQIVGALQNLLNSGAGILNTGLTTETNAANVLGSGSQAALSSIGNAQAAGTLGSANALSSGLTGLTGSAGNAALLYGLGNKLNLGGTNNGIYGGYNYGNPETASAAQAGVQSGLIFNPETGVVA